MKKQEGKKKEKTVMILLLSHFSYDYLFYVFLLFCTVFDLFLKLKFFLLLFTLYLCWHDYVLQSPLLIQNLINKKKKLSENTQYFCWVTKYNSTYPNHHYFVKLIALPFINNRTGYALPRKYNIADRLWIKTTKSLLQHYHNSSWISFVLTSSTSKQRAFCQPVA